MVNSGKIQFGVVVSQQAVIEPEFINLSFIQRDTAVSENRGHCLGVGGAAGFLPGGTLRSCPGSFARRSLLNFFHPRWPVFYEDNHLLVLYKPAGLVMQRGNREKPNLLDMAKEWIRRHHAKPGNVFAGMVHRLDAPVAGVLALARTSKAASRLSGQFRAGSVKKTYLAVVQGTPDRPIGRLEHQLVRRGRYSRPVLGDVPESRVAILSYRLLESGRGRSLLEIDLETGRRHQIRAQLAAIGCPILGDLGYGAGRGLPNGRIALLASKLAFSHPTLKSAMRFESPVPEGWLWPVPEEGPGRPYWSMESYVNDGLEAVPRGS